MRLERIENNTEVECFLFKDCIDCGDYYLLTEWNHIRATLNKNTNLEDLHEKHGGDLYYSKFCKGTFDMYTSKCGTRRYSDDIDEVMNWTKIHFLKSLDDCLLLKTLITGKGFEGLNQSELIVRWSNEKGGRGEYWYRLLRN
jgi:hypothetical protein